MNVPRLDPIGEELLKDTADGVDLLDTTIFYHDNSSLNPSIEMVEIS